MREREGERKHVQCNLKNLTENIPCNKNYANQPYHMTESYDYLAALS